MAMRSSNKRRLLSQGKVADEEVERKKVEIESLEAENDKLRRQIELMNSQSRHANRFEGGDKHSIFLCL